MKHLSFVMLCCFIMSLWGGISNAETVCKKSENNPDELVCTMSRGNNPRCKVLITSSNSMGKLKKNIELGRKYDIKASLTEFKMFSAGQSGDLKKVTLTNKCEKIYLNYVFYVNGNNVGSLESIPPGESGSLTVQNYP